MYCGQTDKIIKYLELALSQEGLKFFQNILKSFGGDEELFENFIRDYLTIGKNCTVPEKDAIYTEFVSYFDKYLNIQGEIKLLEQIAKYAKYYLMITLEYVSDENLKKAVSVINSYEAKDTYPFLMEILDDWENGRIDDNALSNLLNMLTDMVCARQEGAELFSLGMEINKMLINTKPQPNTINSYEQRKRAV